MSDALRCALAVLAIAVLGSAPAFSDEPLVVPVSFDRWMYPFNATPGSRASGSVFGVLDSPGFDNRDAQILIGFDLAVVELPLDQALARLTVELTTSAADTFVYDPSADPLASYMTEPDADAGRPLEMFGVGTRNGFSGLTSRPTTDASLFREATAYSTRPGVFRSSRSAFAADYFQGQAIDVSNNVTEGMAVTPWAVGQTAAVPAGGSVPMNAAFNFSIDLLDGDINAYVAQGLERGELFFALTGLHAASQGGPPTYPSFYLDAAGSRLGPTARLLLTYTAPLTGDFDRNGLRNEADIELLNQAIRQATYDALFDLNRDESLNQADRDQMIYDILKTWYGDADLDGEFNSTDMVAVFRRGEYEDQLEANSSWSEGDWNGDREFNSSDFVTAFAGGGYESGPRAEGARVLSVPEPAGSVLGLLALAGLWLQRHVRRTGLSSEGL